MSLKEKYFLCYINSGEVFNWLAENSSLVQNLIAEKIKWEKEISKSSNFFSDTDLLLVFQDIIILKVLDNNHVSFLSKNYDLGCQTICQKIFKEKKNIILISNNQWKEQNFGERFVVLFKDKESIKNSLESWLQGLSD